MNSESNEEQPQPQPADEIVAELVEETTVTEKPVAAEVVTAAPVVAYDPMILLPPQPAREILEPSPMENLAATGGAVGAIVLGVLAFVGSFISSYAILNSFLGLAMGLWGLRSNHRRMASIGMLLCLISAFFCVVEISSWLQSIWPTEEGF